MAVDVDMEFMYETSYKNLCMDTHTSSTHFYKYFVTNKDEKKLNLHPYLHELDLMISLTIGFIMDTIDDFCELLKLPYNNRANIQLRKLFDICYSGLPDLVKQGVYKKENIALVFSTF